MTRATRGLCDRMGKGFDAGRFFGVLGESFETLDEWQNALTRGYLLLSNRAMDEPSKLDEPLRDALYILEASIEAIIAATEDAADERFAATTKTTKTTKTNNQQHTDDDNLSE